MAELTLLVNSTDTALLSGGAVSPVGPNNTVADSATAGGFAGVLSQQLTPGEGAVVTESPPQNIETQNTQALASGESRPLNGKALPLTTTQNTTQAETTHPVMDASLLSAIAQVSSIATGQLDDGLANNASLLPANPALTKPGAVLQSTLSQLATAKAANKTSMLLPGINSGSPHTMTMQRPVNLQTTKSADPNMTAALLNTAQDAQRSVVAPIIPAQLGRPISVTAEQALARIRGVNGTFNLPSPEMLPVIRSAMANTQNNSVPNPSMGMNNLMGSTMRMEIFNAAIGAATHSRAEQPLPINSATSVPTPLMMSTISPDGAINLFADTSRLPGAAAPTLAVATPVGQPAWASEVGQRVTWLANSELREAQLQLHPRSLGTMEVRIAFGPEQQLNVSFNVTNPIARDALEASLPRLREMFEQQGLNLVDANVSQESPEEREQRNNMDDELLAKTAMQAGNEEMLDEVDLQQTPLHWLSERMLDAYA